jgi:hypothetical protein
MFLYCNDITDDGLIWMLRVINKNKNLKPARHPDVGSTDEDDNVKTMLIQY